MRATWPLAAGLVVLLAVAAGVATLVRNKPTTPRPVHQTTAAPVEIKLSGKVQARTVVDVAVPADGVIERFVANVGEDVFEGELLAQIKNGKLNGVAHTAEGDADRARTRVADLQAAIIAARLDASRLTAEATQAKAELDMAEKAYERQKLLMQQQATPRLVFEKAEADYNRLKGESESYASQAKAAEDRIASLQKDLDTAQKQAQSKSQAMYEAKADLGMGEVHSPVNGVVLARRGQEGEAVTRDIPDLYKIATDLNSLDVVLTPERRYLGKIKAGQTATITIPDAPGPITGTVREITGGHIVIGFTSPTPSIKPGVTAEVALKIV